jgi:3-oxoacid CoA-transferase subunit B
VPELIVIMDHTTREEDQKILNACTYPLTAARCVTRIVTDLASIEVNDGLILRELAPGVSMDYVQERTEPRLRIAPDLRENSIINHI